ncbi:ROK family protein, partial [Francisella tularensis subsp. holarctica]|nr:ROK family protein [Francisella tularensis subsp. holarctica]
MQIKNRPVVGVDIGGTKVNAGRVCGENLLDSYLSKIPPDA